MSDENENDAAAPGYSSRRRRLIEVMDAVFVVLLLVMLLLGSVLVLTQAGGLVTVRPSLIREAAEVLEPWTFAVGGVLGVWTLLLSYAHGWKPTE